MWRLSAHGASAHVSCVSRVRRPAAPFAIRLLASPSPSPAARHFADVRSSAFQRPAPTIPPYLSQSSPSRFAPPPPLPPLPPPSFAPLASQPPPPSSLPPTAPGATPSTPPRTRGRRIRYILLALFLGSNVLFLEDFLRLGLEVLDELHAQQLESFLVDHYAQAGLGDEHTFVGLEEHPAAQARAALPTSEAVSFAADTPPDPLVMETLAAVHPRVILLGWNAGPAITNAARFLLLDSSRKKLAHEFKSDEQGVLVPADNFALAWVARLRACVAELLTKQFLKESRLIAELEHMHPTRIGLKAMRQSRLDRAEYWLSKAILFNREGGTYPEAQHALRQQWMEVSMACERWAVTKRVISQGQRDLQTLAMNQAVDPVWLNRQQFIYLRLRAELSQRQHRYAEALEGWLRCLDAAELMRKDVIDQLGEVVPASELDVVEEDPLNAYLSVFTQLSHCALKAEAQAREATKAGKKVRGMPQKSLSSLATQGVTGALVTMQLMSEVGFYLPHVVVDEKSAPRPISPELNHPSDNEDDEDAALHAGSDASAAAAAGVSPSPAVPASVGLADEDEDEEMVAARAVAAFDADLPTRLASSVFIGSPFEAFLRPPTSPSPPGVTEEAEHPNELMDYISREHGFNPFQLTPIALVDFQIEVARGYQQLGRLLQARGNEAGARRAFDLAQQGTKTQWLQPYAEQAEEAGEYENHSK